MATPSSRAAGESIFLSYRREDSRHLAGRLFDRLSQRFGRSNIFMDIDSIRPGVDFAEAIDNAVSSCKVLLAIIGPRWIDALDEHGRRRLNDPADLVVLEICSALRQHLLVIPVLVDGAAPPRYEELPAPLTALARRNAVRLDHETFGSDADAILAAIASILNDAESEDATNVHSAEPSSEVHGDEDEMAVQVPNMDSVTPGGVGGEPDWISSIGEEDADSNGDLRPDRAGATWSRGYRIGAVCVVLIAALSIIAAWVFQPSVSVPRVAGLQYEDALKVLADAGLSSRVTTGQSSPELIGRVVYTDPQANTIVGTGSDVIVYVGAVSPRTDTSVPNLRGYTKDGAIELLKDAALVLGKEVEEPVSNSRDVGSVIDQNPPANSSAFSGDAVDITVGRAR